MKLYKIRAYFDYKGYIELDTDNYTEEEIREQLINTLKDRIEIEWTLVDGGTE